MGCLSFVVFLSMLSFSRDVLALYTFKSIFFLSELIRFFIFLNIINGKVKIFLISFNFRLKLNTKKTIVNKKIYKLYICFQLKELSYKYFP